MKPLPSISTETFWLSLKNGQSKHAVGKLNCVTNVVDRWTLPDASVVTDTATGAPSKLALADSGLESSPAPNVKTSDPREYCARRLNSRPLPPAARSPPTTASKLIDASTCTTPGITAQLAGKHQSSA